ncbi:unnamed protein product [Mesocestoides corti]|uniref:non-specific serine/threonine protein kinase n=1 Tax=Mesocestoides corti TaxID=53468 RepID=A0A0R3UQ87_MESCO|nr:unnamed protein product [Mesocestoides corti]
MRKILALLSHGENEVTSPHNHIGGSGCSSSGLQLGKQVTINNQRFTLDSVIAEGGFGIVYRVHSSSGRRFALKRTLVNSEAGVSAMKREITIVSSLSHKNIVSYITSQVSEKEPGIYEVLLLTAYYPSKSSPKTQALRLTGTTHLMRGSVSRILNERQQKKEAFLESEVLRILADLCEAVSRLHHCQTPIIHRDLKMVDLYTDGGQPLGTPVDIWALGCLTYGVCFFSLPFGSSTLAIQTGQYTTPDSCSYSTKLLKLINYMLTIPISKRPDIHQVAALTFSLLDRPNPVPNVNVSRLLSANQWFDICAEV